MSPQDIDINELSTEIALIKKDIENLEVLIRKIDELSKEVNELSKLIAIQHRIVEDNEKKISSLFDITNKEDIDEGLYRGRMRDKIDSIKNEIHSDKEDLKRILSVSSSSINDKIDEDYAKTDKRLSVLENWRWWVMGMGVVIVTVISYVWKILFTS